LQIHLRIDNYLNVWNQNNSTGSVWMKTAMVWGAEGGIGRALIKELIAGGWKTIGVSRAPASDDEGNFLTLESDVSKSWEIENAIYQAGMEIDQIDLWVYAVGDISAEKVDVMEPETWTRIIDANLTGAYLTTHYSMPLLADDAVMVFLGAVSERLRLPGLSAYAAAKAGLEGFAEALWKEERKKRVILVRPSAVVTPLWEKVPLRVPADAPAPEKVAHRIVEAVNEGFKGRLDLTGSD
jgi:NAD(P)-dependent dehydrogenase (short-subunit alcohol dehydrogenase family)